MIHHNVNHHSYETLQSELVFDAPIISVRRDLVSMPNNTAAHREVVEHMGAVAVAAINERNEIALISQYRHSVGDRLWELPAGILDVAGEEALVGAQRELWEEAGLRAQRWDLLVDIVTSPGFCEEAVRVFLARDLSEEERPEAADDEEADLGFKWVGIEQAVAEVLSGGITNSIAVAGIMTAAAVVRGDAPPRSIEEPFSLRPTSIASRRNGRDLKEI